MFKSFLLFGGTDVDRVILATLIRRMYGARTPVGRKIDPAVDELAVMSGVAVQWVADPDPGLGRGGFHGTPGSGGDFTR